MTLFRAYQDFRRNFGLLKFGHLDESTLIVQPDDSNTTSRFKKPGFELTISILVNKPFIHPKTDKNDVINRCCTFFIWL